MRSDEIGGSVALGFEYLKSTSKKDCFEGED